MAYEMVADFIRKHDGDCEWKPGGNRTGGFWHVKLGGREIRFPFLGTCPLDTLKVPKIDSPTDADHYYMRLRPDAIFMLTAMFDRPDVETVA